jgi:hypothetical protein
VPAVTSRIEAEAFDQGGEGCAYHDTTVANEGGQGVRSGGVDILAFGTSGDYQVVHIQTGEWLKYTVIVAADGPYAFTFRVASLSGSPGSFHLEDELGTNLTGLVDIPATGGVSTFADVTKGDAALKAGGHVLKVVVDSGNDSWSFNYFSARGCEETDAAFCARLGKDCGSVTALDHCSLNHTVASCGTCSGAKTCGGGGALGVCGCQPETDAAFCSRLGKMCGGVTDTDNCGTSRTVASCGTCP